MKRILVISWFYPPINSSEALVTAKLLKYSRYEYDVFTQGRSEAWSYGRDPDLPAGGNQRRIAAESGELSLWAEEAVRFFEAHRADYDLIMTRSMPPECHLAGLRIKQRFPDVRWIASFGDPIARNPYEILGGLWSPYSLKSPINQNRSLRFRLSPLRLVRDTIWTLRSASAVQRRRMLESIEENTLRLADRLVFNNTSQQQYMLGGKRREDKSVILRHSFDPALYPKAVPNGARQKLRFVFLGQLNEIRSPQPLFQAIHMLKESMPELPERAEFLFFGEMPDAALASVLRLEIGELVQVRRPISYRQSLAEAAAADWLLHIDGNIGAVCGENIFFAGKLADYFGAGKPILAVTMAEGDAADCLRRAGALLLSFSVNEIKQALFQIIFRGKRIHMDTAYLQSFSAPQVAAILDEKVVKPLL